MKRDTRQAILDTAKTLFSQRGYNDVAIGEIAGALGISKGNLTYHFKKEGGDHGGHPGLPHPHLSQ